MSAHEFIILRIHPLHPKVQRLSVLTGDDPDRACGKSVRWFRYVDEHFAGAETGLTRDAFNSVIGTPRRRVGSDYFDAMQDQHVNWISTDEHGCAVVVDYEDNFSRSSKRRAMDARYQSAKRRQFVGNSSAIRRHDERRNDELQKQKQKHEEEIPPVAARRPPVGGSTPIASSVIAWTEGDGFSGIGEYHRARWAQAYPACDIDRQLASMHAWLMANPTRARKSNWMRFIDNWLRKEQDRGGDERTRSATGGGSASAAGGGRGAAGGRRGAHSVGDPNDPSNSPARVRANPDKYTNVGTVVDA